MTTQCVFPLAYKVVISLLLALTAFLSPLLNSLVCFTIYRTTKLRTTGNFLIANLAAADALNGLLLAPLEVVYVACFPSWPVGNAGTYIINAAFLFSLVLPFVIVTVITIERYIVIKSNSIAASQDGTSRRALWLTSLGMWGYSLVAVAVMTGNFTKPENNEYSWNVKPSLYYPFLGLHIVIPFCIVCLAYRGIFRITKNTHSDRLESSTSSRSLLQQRELKLAKTLGIVIGLLFLVWLPVLVIECFYATESTSCVTEAAGPVSVWLTVSSGVMNPVVYFYRNSNLRTAFYKTVGFRKRGASQLTASLLQT